MEPSDPAVQNAADALNDNDVVIVLRERAHPATLDKVIDHIDVDGVVAPFVERFVGFGRVLHRSLVIAVHGTEPLRNSGDVHDLDEVKGPVGAHAGKRRIRLANRGLNL